MQKKGVKSIKGKKLHGIFDVTSVINSTGNKKIPHKIHFLLGNLVHHQSGVAYDCLFAFRVPRMYYMQRVRRSQGTREGSGAGEGCEMGVTKQRECLV